VLLRVLSFPSPNPVLQQCLADMHAFANSNTFMDRQLYLRVVEGAVGQLPQELLEQFLQRALPLCNDRTSNVRLATAHMLRAVLSHPHVQQSPSAREMVQRLSNDTHAEVRRCMAEAQAAHAASQITNSLATLNIAEGAAAGAGAGGSAAAAASNDGELNDADLQDILAGPSSTTEDAAAASAATAEGGASAAATAVAPVAAASVADDESDDSSLPDAPSDSAADSGATSAAADAQQSAVAEPAADVNADAASAASSAVAAAASAAAPSAAAGADDAADDSPAADDEQAAEEDDTVTSPQEIEAEVE
jgi:hypothetical protein